MDHPTQTDRRRLRDWFIITVIILIGFLCLIVAGWMAVRFAPSWQLASNMNSSIDPNSEYLTRRPQGYIEPVDAAILTPPVWIGFFQTPGATVPQQTPLPTRTAVLSTSVVMPTVTGPVAATLIPTNTIVYIPVSPTNTTVHNPASPTNTQRPAPSNTATATATTTATGTSTATATATATATGTPTNISSVEADLAITKDDGVSMYSAGGTLTYTVIVTNNGPASATGVIVSDDFLVSHFESWSWKCTALNGGASGCDATASNAANFIDTVDLPNGASIIYTVTVRVLNTASGDLVNTAKVGIPAANTDLNTFNNQDSDTDQFLATSPLPMGNIGETKNGNWELLGPGSVTTLSFSTPLVVNGHAGYDLVYYEMPHGAGIAMDIVALEISDGNNWYTIFYWGDNVADTNSTMNFSALGESPADNPEIDNRDFFTSPPPGLLYNGTGVAIQLDGVVPPGTYPYIRIISPPTAAYPYGVSTDAGCEVDAIVILN